MVKNRPNRESASLPQHPEQLLNNKQTVEAIIQSREAKQLMDILNQNSGQNLKDAAQAALKGDTTQLAQLVDHLKQNPQSARLMENLQKKING